MLQLMDNTILKQKVDKQILLERNTAVIILKYWVCELINFFMENMRQLGRSVGIYNNIIIIIFIII